MSESKDGCTRDHKHRYLRVRWNGRLHKFMQVPLWSTSDQYQAKASPYPYRAVEYAPPGWDFIAYDFVLTLTGVCHRWFGLTLVTVDETGEAFDGGLGGGVE